MSNQDAKVVNVSSESDDQTQAETVTAVQARPKSEPLPTEPSDSAKDRPSESPPSVEDLTKQLEENRDRWIRAVAELENFKKRSAAERARLLQYKNEELLKDLLPIVDNMERALNHCEATGRSDAFVDGVCMILGMFRDVLKKYGVTEVASLGEVFDPYRHEALMKVPVPDKEPNVVVEVFEKGYLYGDRLLRAAKVGISTLPEPDGETESKS